MVLNKVDADRLGCGKTAYSSTSSASCRTPLSGSSSAASDCTVSPGQTGRKISTEIRPRSLKRPASPYESDESNSRYRLRHRKVKGLQGDGTPLEDALSLSNPYPKVSELLRLVVNLLS